MCPLNTPSNNSEFQALSDSNHSHKILLLGDIHESNDPDAKWHDIMSHFKVDTDVKWISIMQFSISCL